MLQKDFPMFSFYREDHSDQGLSSKDLGTKGLPPPPPPPPPTDSRSPSQRPLRPYLSGHPDVLGPSIVNDREQQKKAQQPQDTQWHFYSKEGAGAEKTPETPMRIREQSAGPARRSKSTSDNSTKDTVHTSKHEGSFFPFPNIIAAPS